MSGTLWKCPSCGHRFVTRNMWHSCTNYSLEHHFERCSPSVRATFDRFLELLEPCGPVTVISQKTRIAIQAQVRFAGCITRKNWLIASLWLTHKAEHPRLQSIEEYGPASFGHRFRLDTPQDIDQAFHELIREAYRVGLRQHLERGAMK